VRKSQLTQWGRLSAQWRRAPNCGVVFRLRPSLESSFLCRLAYLLGGKGRRKSPLNQRPKGAHCQSSAPHRPLCALVSNAYSIHARPRRARATNVCSKSPLLLPSSRLLPLAALALGPKEWLGGATVSDRRHEMRSNRYSHFFIVFQTRHKTPLIKAI